MRKEASAKHMVRHPRVSHATGLSLLVLLLALVGVIVAALSQAPIVWMLSWPTPLVLIFTAARFIREGVHRRDGVLVLGRPALEAPHDPHNVAVDDKQPESLKGERRTGSNSVEALSVFARRRNVKPGATASLAIHRHIRKNPRRSWRFNVPYVLQKGTVG